VEKVISVTIINLITPKAGAKHELLFNKPPYGQQAIKTGIQNNNLN
jgi:hypothetical protein